MSISFAIGGAGSATPAITVDDNHIFSGLDKAACETARDAYFVSNPSELIEGVYVTLQPADTGTPILQEYRSAVWVDVTALIRGPSGVTGVTSINGASGIVTLDPDDLDDTSTVNKFVDAATITKISGIEDNATADQTGAEIKVAYEAEANTNAFTDANLNKLTGIEDNATADQTGAEIKVAYEAEANTNAYTDAEVVKLGGIEEGAQVNPALVSQSDAEAGTDTTLKSWTPERVSQAIQAISFKAPNNLQVINSASDFPAPVGGIITLPANTNYVIGDNVTIAATDKFQVGDNVSITGNNVNAPTLTYLGTDALFNGTDVNFDIHHIQLTCPNRGDLFDFTDTIGGTKIVTMDTVRAQVIGSWGTFNNLQSLVIENSSCLDSQDGISVIGDSWIVLSIIKFALLTNEPLFTGLDLGASLHTNIELDNLLFIGTAGGTGISGLASNGNVRTNNVATLSNSSFNGVTALAGLTADDYRWNFSANTDIGDTHPDASLSLTGNTTETVIAAANTPVKVAGTWSIFTESHFAADATGRATYLGEKPVRVPLSCTITGVTVAGPNRNIKWYIAKNGTPIVDSGQSNTVKSGESGNTTILWQLSAVTGDYFEIWVEADAIVNIIAQDANFLIN